MAHFVAKELKVRPYDILTTWTVEELMVAFGEYANAHALEAWEMMDAKERRKKGKIWTDRWAVLFVPLEDALKMQNEDTEQQRVDEIQLQNAADILF